MRTTVDIDDPILKEVKKLQKPEGKSLGRLISDLLALALQERKASKQKHKPRRWIARGMKARIDLRDKEALYEAMEREHLAGEKHDNS